LKLSLFATSINMFKKNHVLFKKQRIFKAVL
jgi:hypothetical protein